MEFKTTQGGTTTLVFDGQERAVLGQLVKRYGMTEDRLVDTIGRLRQADPLASFTDLVNRLPSMLSAAGNTRPKRAGVAAIEALAADPLADLEADIKRRLLACRHPGGQATSQMQQTEATLLHALATCLLARQMSVIRMLVDNAMLTVNPVGLTDG